MGFVLGMRVGLGRRDGFVLVALVDVDDVVHWGWLGFLVFGG